MFCRNHQPLPSPLVFGGVAARFVVHCCDNRMALNTFSRKSHFQLVPRAEMRSHVIKDAYDLLYSVDECCSHITPRAAVHLKHAKQIADFLSSLLAGKLPTLSHLRGLESLKQCYLDFSPIPMPPPPKFAKSWQLWNVAPATSSSQFFLFSYRNPTSGILDLLPNINDHFVFLFHAAIFS